MAAAGTGGNRKRHRAVTGDKYHRNAPAANVQLLLKFDPGHARHLYIKQQATAPSRVVGFEKGQCRRRGFDRVPGRAQQKAEPFPHACVIVDDEYCFIRHGDWVRIRLSAGQTQRSHRSQHVEAFAVFRHATRRSSG